MKAFENTINHRARLRHGFSLVEILIALLVVAALAAGTIYLVSNVNQSAVDAKKTETAQKMTEMAVMLWQSGVSFDALDTTGAIDLLKVDHPITSQIPGGSDINVHMEQPFPNASAYVFVAPLGVGGPRFRATLKQPNIAAFLAPVGP